MLFKTDIQKSNAIVIVHRKHGKRDQDIYLWFHLRRLW